MERWSRSRIPSDLGTRGATKSLSLPLSHHSEAGRPASSWRRDTNEVAAADGAARNGPWRALSRCSRSSFLQSASQATRRKRAGLLDLPLRLLQTPHVQSVRRPEPHPAPVLSPGHRRKSPGEEHEDGPPLDASRRGCHHTLRQPPWRVPGPAWPRQVRLARLAAPARPPRHTGVVAPGCRALRRSVGGVGSLVELRLASRRLLKG